jgi:putative mRNA 3-end processing factor
VRCHTFITESTFGLPVFRWRSQTEIFAEINAWWRRNRQQGRTSILYAYALGKAQRLLAGLDENIGPIYTHGALETFNRIYRDVGVRLAPSRHVGEAESRKDFTGALVIAPPSADNPGWLRRFPSRAKAFVSGWMQIRGHRRRRAVDRGFVLSDHADWDGLNRAVADTGALNVWTTHGYAAEFARWLQVRGYRTKVLATRFTGETDEEVPEEGYQRQPTDFA